MEHTYNPSSSEALRHEDPKFQASLQGKSLLKNKSSPWAHTFHLTKTQMLGRSQFKDTLSKILLDLTSTK
jgi:hypothetical protein